MALLSEEEKQQLKQIMADYPNNEDLDLTAYIADVIGITGKHVEEGCTNLPTTLRLLPTRRSERLQWLLISASLSARKSSNGVI